MADDEGTHPGSEELCEGLGRAVVELANGRMLPVFGFGTANIGGRREEFVPTEEFQPVLPHHICPEEELKYNSPNTTQAKWKQRKGDEPLEVLHARRRLASAATHDQLQREHAKQHDYVEAVIKGALQIGYRFFDCAECHGNEAAVGSAWRSSCIERDELFLQSKVWTTTIAKGSAAIWKSVTETIHALDCDYLDCLLLHWPVPRKFVDAWGVLEELVDRGLVRSIGLANFTKEDYLELKPHIRTYAPVVNQIEVNPLLFRRDTIDFFKAEGLVVQASSPLCGGVAYDHMRATDPEGWMLKLNPALSTAAMKHSRSVAQVMGRWVLEHGCVLVAKAERWEHAVENAALFDFDLDDGDMERLDALTGHDALENFRVAYRTGCVQGCASLELQHRVDLLEARNGDEFSVE